MGEKQTNLVLGGITNQPLSVSETNIRGSGTVTLVVGDNLHAVCNANGCSRLDTDPHCFYLNVPDAKKAATGEQR